MQVPSQIPLITSGGFQFPLLMLKDKLQSFKLKLHSRSRRLCLVSVQFLSSVNISKSYLRHDLTDIDHYYVLRIFFPIPLYMVKSSSKLHIRIVLSIFKTWSSKFLAYWSLGLCYSLWHAAFVVREVWLTNHCAARGTAWLRYATHITAREPAWLCYAMHITLFG